MERESGEKMTTIGGDGGRGRSIGARGRSVGARGRSVVARGRSAGGVRGRSVAVRARSVVEGAIARGRGRSLRRGGSRGVARGRGRSLGRRGFHARGRSPTPEARSMSAGPGVLVKRTEEGKAKEVLYYIAKSVENARAQGTYFGIPVVEEVEDAEDQEGAGEVKGTMQKLKMKPPKINCQIEGSASWISAIKTGCSAAWGKESQEVEHQSDSSDGGPIFSSDDSSDN